MKRNLAPTPSCQAFPRSWKKRRMLREGEILRHNDRVAWNWYSIAITTSKGAVVGAKNAKSFPQGWYWRKTA